ncbi:MAG TPA: hypothetical protein VJ900_01385 [Patescibacteria group bacterium]|nr:hypothetical protein [Patescibacteria group bacterium]
MFSGFFLKYIIAGFFAKFFASFDDMAARIPIIAHFAKDKKGRIAFCFGNLIAVFITVIIAYLLAGLLEGLKNIHIFTSLLIVILAFVVFFDLFGKKKDERVKDKKKKIIKKVHKTNNFLKLTFVGFIFSLITLLDDLIVLAPLFLTSLINVLFIVFGIFVSTFIQLFVVIYFSEKISRLSHVKEIASIGLIILAVLIYLQVL